MSSPTVIANMALSQLGQAKEISDISLDVSQEASACRRYYETARNQVLRDFPWPFATVIAPLGLVQTTPNSEWAYSYRMPSDCVMFRRILSGIRNDTHFTRVPYRIARDSGGQLIFTDYANAVGEYTYLEDNPDRYPSDFTMALSLLLAAYIAPRVTGGDPFKLGDRAQMLYRIAVDEARVNAANEEQRDVLPEAEFISGRD